jgi:hypothetical protein
VRGIVLPRRPPFSENGSAQVSAGPAVGNGGRTEAIRPGCGEGFCITGRSAGRAAGCMAARSGRHFGPTERVVKTRPEPVAASGGIVGPPERAARSLDPLARVGRGMAEASMTPKTTPLARGVKMGCLEHRPTSGRSMSFRCEPCFDANREGARFPREFFAF